ncbi:MAG: cation transporter [Lachnospira sp.]|nr:cation transporter [Lachnospira sp.]
MAGLLIRLFVKDSENIKEPKVRAAYGMLSGVVGIVCNCILFICKFIAGLLTGAVSVSADAFNNLSDAGSSIVTFIGFRMAGKPADHDHPFGHGRIEYVSGLIVAMAIVVMGYELFTQALDRIFNPQDTDFGIISIGILIGSILMKMWMAYFNNTLGKKIDSAAMKATATDSLSDCISTTVVLVSLIVSGLTDFNIDGYAGLVVAAFVLMAGVEAAKDTLNPLLGEAAEPEFVQQLEALVMENELIIGVHDVIVHNYGPGRVFASMHAEVPYNVDVLEAHDIIDLAEHKIKAELGCEVSIHMDPVITDDEEINKLKVMVQEVVHEIGGCLKIHDFRVTKGPYITNLIFDVLVPYDFAIKDDDLIERIAGDVAIRDSKCKTVVNIDKDFVRK